MSNHEHDAASNEGMPSAPEPETTSPADTDTTFVVPEGIPFWCTAVNLPQEDGATLVIERDGSHVPTANLEALREQAATSGILLNTEVSD